MPVTADPVTTISDTGDICCGVCDSSIFASLPAIFKSVGQGVAAVTAANNASCLAKLNASTNLQVAQLNANNSQKIMMDVLIAGVVVIGLYIALRGGK